MRWGRYGRNSANAAGTQPSAPVIDEQAARRNLWVLMAVIVGISIPAMIVGTLLAHSHPSARAHAHHGAGLAAVVIAAVILFAFVAALLLVMSRRPSWRAAMQYGWRRRNRVAKALRKGRPIPAEDLPVAAALMALMAKQRWLPYLFGVLVLIWLIQGLTESGTRRWLGFALAGLYVLLTPYLLWQRRRCAANYDRQLALRDHQQPPDS